MDKLFDDLFSYLKAVFIDTWQKIFTFFDLLGIGLFIYPEIAQEFTDERKSLIKATGALIVLLSFLIANFTVYRKLSIEASTQAEFRLEVLEHDFSHSYGTRKSPFVEIQSSPLGFNSQGIPDWGSLWANIRIANIGYEKGRLSWELNEGKTSLPALFLSKQASVDFCPSEYLEGRLERSADFFFDVMFADRDPTKFVWALKDLVRQKRRYRVVLNYKTIRIDGESSGRELIIEGDFSHLFQKVLDYWDNYGHSDMSVMARSA